MSSKQPVQQQYRRESKMRLSMVWGLKLGRVFGFSPFHINSNGDLTFRGCSFTTFYFLLLLLAILIWNIAYFVVVINSLLVYPIVVALAFLPWFCGSLSLLTILLFYWFRRTDILKHVNTHLDWWNSSIDNDLKKRTEQKARMIFGAWILSACCILFNSTYMQVVSPGGVGFLSTYFLDPETNTVSSYIHVGSLALHVWLMVFYNFGTLIGDLVIIICALHYAVAFRAMTRDMKELCKDFMEIKSNSKDGLVSHNSGDRSSNYKLMLSLVPDQMTMVPSAKKDLRTMIPCDFCCKKASQQLQIADKIRMAIRRHMRVTSCLQSFNHIFAPLIFLFTIQMFIMCALIIYGSFIVKFSPTENLMHFLDGVAFFMKATIGFYCFGSVADAGTSIKSAILMNEEIYHSKVIAEDDDLARELLLFFDFLSEACVNPGGCMTFSRSYLATFYGIVITYLALILQSVSTSNHN